MARFVILGIIFALCAGCGYRFASVYRCRPRILHDIMTQFSVLEQRLQYYAEPLHHALVVAGSQRGSIAERVFFAIGEELEQRPEAHPEDVAEEWISGLRASYGVTANDRIMICNIFYGISQHGKARDQAFDYGRQQLTKAIEEAEMVRDRYAKLYQTAGILVGGAIVVLLA